MVGMGKAAAAMAQAVEHVWFGELSGVVVVPPNAVLPLQRIRILEGSHPIPDHKSVTAAEALLLAVRGLTVNDLVVALISGGGSSLACAPAPGITLDDKRAITQELLLKGATIREMNVVRKHLSAIKGGRLAAAAYPAKVVSILISDIPGDDIPDIASGPTLPDESTSAQALAILVRHRIGVSSSVREHLTSIASETIKSTDRRLARNSAKLVASAVQGLAAAAGAARAAGIDCHVLSDRVEGESKEIAKMHAAIALACATHGQPFNAPCVLLSGGEATVTVQGQGRGGRNTEFVLSAAFALQQHPRTYVLSAGTDGLDGNSGAAGAWAGPETLLALERVGIDPLLALAENDSGTALGRVNQLVTTGATHTNINDFRAIWVEA